MKSLIETNNRTKYKNMKTLKKKKINMYYNTYLVGLFSN